MEGGKQGVPTTPNDDPPIERWRVPHCVPLGSIFVWSVEATILSICFLSATVTLQGVLGASATEGVPGKVNIMDQSTSSISVACTSITMIAHLAIANALNRQSLAGWAGALHSAVSNASCTVVFVACFTYISAYVDSCLLGMPTEDMCLALFRVTPMPDIVVGVASSFMVLLLLVSVALSFVSCPQDQPSYLFVSKGSLLVATTMFSWVVPAGYNLARSNSVPCQEPQAGPGNGGGPFLAFAYLSCITGACAALVEWWCESVYWPGVTSFWKRVGHLAMDIWVPILAVIVVSSAFAGRSDNGPTGLAFSMISMWCLIVWSSADVAVNVLYLTGTWGATAVAEVAEKKDTPPAPKAQQGGEGGAKSNYAPPFLVTHMSVEDRDSYSAMKKADTMPMGSVEGVAITDTRGGGVQSLFSTEDVRMSLRQRPPAPTTAPGGSPLGA